MSATQRRIHVYNELYYIASRYGFIFFTGASATTLYDNAYVIKQCYCFDHLFQYERNPDIG